MRPILFPTNSVNQRYPSGPVTMAWGDDDAVGMVNSVKPNGGWPSGGTTRTISLRFWSANQMLPSGPMVIPRGPAPDP